MEGVERSLSGLMQTAHSNGSQENPPRVNDTKVTPQLTRWLDWIVEEHHKHRPTGLHRAKQLAEDLCLTNPATKTVVVAGTNGKGSTVRYLEHLLQSGNLKVGATYSPHLEQYNERIRVCGESVSDEEIVHSFEVIEQARQGIPLTYFEWATLAALDVFKRNGVDRAILEVGLGGRLDTCNVVDRDICVITNIGLDHSHILGSDRETIGSEKAGILQAQIPLVYGDEKPVTSVLSRALTLECPLYLANHDYGHTTSAEGRWMYWAKEANAEISFSLEYLPSMPDSAALALQTVGVLEHQSDPLKSVDLSKCNLPGRMEHMRYRNQDLLLDVGHNPDAAQYIRRQLDLFYPGRDVGLLFACKEDKDAPGILDGLGVPDHRVLVSSTFGHRGQSAEMLAKKLYPRPVRVEPDLEVAVDYLLGSNSSHDLILVAGSFELVSRVRNMITIGMERRG